MRTVARLSQRQRAGCNLPLDGFLPGPVDEISHPELGKRLAVRANDAPVDDLEKPQLDFDLRLGVSQDEALGLHEPGIIATALLAVFPWVDSTEGPTLLVLGGGSRVGKEEVALVE